MSSQISATKAKEYIDNYLQGLPPGSLQSAWIDRSFIDAIVALNSTQQLDGVRVYLARYTEDVSLGNVSVTAGTETVIIVPTEGGFAGGRNDIESAYYDYAHLCPPHCKP